MVGILIGTVLLAAALAIAGASARMDMARFANRMRLAGALIAGGVGIVTIVVTRLQAAPFMVPLLAIAATLFAGWRRRARQLDLADAMSARMRERFRVVETATLRMELDTQSGELDGEVLTGSYAGARLSDLDDEALARLAEEIAASDTDGATLLAAFRSRRAGNAEEEEADREQSQARSPGGLSIAEAREILGVGEDAGEEEIRAAHRALAKRFHPDLGGSAYLMVKINAARDLLLKERT